MDKLFLQIDKNEKVYIDRLSEVVAIQSVSAWPEKRPEITKMMEWTQKELEKLGATCELQKLGDQTLPDGSKIPLPPVLLGQLGKDPAKKTILVYGHLDVQPAEKEDGWDTEPFVLTEKDGKLYGRGSTDDKGPVLAWINCIEAMQQLKMEVPVNMKFIFEGMEESGSEGLDELVFSKKDTFLKGTDFVCISDNYWLGKTKPCLTYGLRGICYFFAEVECASKDLHSGVFGGSVHEAMVDLVNLLNSLVTNKGEILVPGINEGVAPVTEDEKKLYEPIDFDVGNKLNLVHIGGRDFSGLYLRNYSIFLHETYYVHRPIEENAYKSPKEDVYSIDLKPLQVDYCQDVGATKLMHDNKEKVLMHRWRFPSLSIHGIEGAFSGAGAKTVIPRKVTGKFSIRIVPNLEPDQVEKCVKTHLEKVHKDSGSPNKLKVSMGHGGRYWLSDFNHPHYIAGKEAMKKVFGMEPDMTREGGSIPVTLTFQEATGKNVMLLPIGACDDGAHSQNEKIDKSNYINGVKVLGAYMDEVSKLEQTDKAVEVQQTN